MSELRLMHGIPERPELDRLFREAVAAFEALSPEEKRALRQAQRRSWVRGEMMLEHPEMTAEYVNKLLDEAGI